MITPAQCRPADASGEYKTYQGKTWIKDLDMSEPRWPLAYLWSHTAKRWRKKRQTVDMKRVVLFGQP